MRMQVGDVRLVTLLVGLSMLAGACSRPSAPAPAKPADAGPQAAASLASSDSRLALTPELRKLLASRMRPPPDFAPWGPRTHLPLEALRPPLTERSVYVGGGEAGLRARLEAFRSTGVTGVIASCISDEDDPTLLIEALRNQDWIERFEFFDACEELRRLAAPAGGLKAELLLAIGIDQLEELTLRSIDSMAVGQCDELCSLFSLMPRLRKLQLDGFGDPSGLVCILDATTLKSLRVGDVLMTDEVARRIAEEELLEVLELSGDCSRPALLALTKLPRLEFLGLRAELTLELVDALARMPRLRGLRLRSRGDIEASFVQLLASSATLAHLDLSGCEALVDADLHAWTDNTSLRCLDLRGCKRLTPECFEALGALPSLEALVLDASPYLTQDRGRALSLLPNVRTLYLAMDDTFVYLDYPDLRAPPQLQRFVFFGRTEPDGPSATRLRRDRPELMWLAGIEPER